MHMMKSGQGHIFRKEEPIVDADPYSRQAMTVNNCKGSGRKMMANRL